MIVKRITDFIKKETVLTAAFVLAIISMFFVAPSEKYIEYIDFRVLGILLSLMIIMSAFQRTGIFDKIGTALLKRTKNIRQLCIVLVMLCFFLSMLITNDVALITFVPFSLLTLKKANREDKMIFVIVLQTIAANLGSMLTPTGNPQNLYLYNLSGMSFFDFIIFMLPYTAASFVLLIVIIMFCKKESINKNFLITEKANEKSDNKNKILTIIYTVLFALGIMSVCHILPYYILLAIVAIVVFVCDKKVFLKVDYCLILTFVCFFIFIGNIKNVDIVRNFLEQAVYENEITVGILSSQVVSNVPAALMLSGFTNNYNALLVGVNIGGLGTLIASMASLISYKIYAQNYNDSKGKYMLWFTMGNILFLAVLWGLAVLIA